MPLHGMQNKDQANKNITTQQVYLLESMAFDTGYFYVATRDGKECRTELKKYFDPLKN